MTMAAIPRGSNITHCPHCGAMCRTVKSDQIGPTYREVLYDCSNPDCGHVFVATIIPVRTIFPSSTPNPEIRLPVPEKLKG